MTETNNTKEIPGLGGRDWEALYSAADRIWSLQPWEIFCEIDIAEVFCKNAEEAYYCSLGGMFDEKRSVSVFRGESGLIELSQYISLRDAGVDERIANVRRDGLELSWGSRERLRSRDRRILKNAGHSYRGRDVWPLFRSLQQGMEDWYLEEEEAAEMAEVLTELANGMEELIHTCDRAVLEAGNRMCRHYDAGEDRWITELIPPLESISMTTQGCLITDEILLRRLKKKKCNGADLEMEAAFVPLKLHNTKQRERSFYPKLCVLCDADSGIVEEHTFVDRNEEIIDIVLSMFIHYVEQNGRPLSVHVRDAKMYGILGHLCENIGVGVYVTASLEAVEDYFNDLLDLGSGNE